MKKDRTDIVCIIFALIMLFGTVYFMTVNIKDKFEGYEGPTTKVIRVADVTSHMYDEEVVLIKTSDNYIMYEGNVRLLDTFYNKEEVEYIGACDDSQEPITTIILKKDKETIDFWLSL